MTFGALGGFLRTPKNPPGYGPEIFLRSFENLAPEPLFVFEELDRLHISGAYR